jgi:hypothetical protein
MENENSLQFFFSKTATPDSSEQDESSSHPRVSSLNFIHAQAPQETSSIHVLRLLFCIHCAHIERVVLVTPIQFALILTPSNISWKGKILRPRIFFIFPLYRLSKPHRISATQLYILRKTLLGLD